VLKETEEGAAVVRIDLTGKFPPGVSGPLKLVWNDDEDEPLALEVITPRPGKKPKISVMRLAPRDEPTELMTIEASGVVEETKDSTLAGWIAAGFEHILPKGLDHILFILGLFLLQPKWRALLWQSSAFTIAHSITLALAILGIVTVPSSVVEPLIALSIALLAADALRGSQGNLTARPAVAAFTFGLLHGMGLANAIAELDLPRQEIPIALGFFNLGVEIGQLAFVLPVLAAAALLHRASPDVGRRLIPAAATVIGVTAMFWFIDRTLGIFS
jgi:hydrogenase/urease accessory protein HupE